ncbi:MAG: response regulator [Deltaproteobacteria bacterium]|nr:response regulator [Deltaproteobacteria bacterium]
MGQQDKGSFYGVDVQTALASNHRFEERPRILVVDDEAVICEVLRDFLTFEGFDVSVAGSGEKALEILHNDPFYELVLTDLKMPGMGGLELMRRIDIDFSDLVTVIMTGFGTVESAIDAMKHGAFDYILKPFKPEDVVRVLRRGLEKLKLTRENVALKETIGSYELSEALSSAMPLDDQLKLIIDLVGKNFDADGVAIIIEDPQNPRNYISPIVGGKSQIDIKTPIILERLINGDAIIAHGNDVCNWIEEHENSNYAIHSFMAAPLKIRGATFGLVSVISTRREHRFTEGQRKGLSIFGGRAANAIETARIYKNLQETFTQTIESFARALEAKDTYTHGHSDRVAMYARMIAKSMNLPIIEVDKLQHGGLLHDVGKIGIRSVDLNKPQKLTPAEYLMFKSHPVQGKRIIEPISFLNHLVACVYYHHEAWDGSGYPEGLAGTAIPLEARILAVADSYDAMTSNRPYRKALPHDIAVAEFKRCSGRQFDPQVVKAFLSVIDDFRNQRRLKGLPVPE